MSEADAKVTTAGARNGPAVPPAAAGSTAGRPIPLDDVMIAMDVVDTLRHDERLVERELADGERRKALIERLRRIYREQGIEVPDRILEQGVQALEEDRFVYKPPPDTMMTRLARLYVTRDGWGRVAAGVAIALALAAALHLAFVAWPRMRAAEAERIELTQTLPAEFDRLSRDIASESKEPSVATTAAELAQTGRNAAKAGDAVVARRTRDRLDAMLTDLRAEYRVRIVSRRGELSGLWRVPRANPNTYNFYLVVEAVGSDGKVIPQSIENEETGRRETVSTWAVRVPREVLEKVEADKRDDGIIQNAEVGRKERGKLARSWSIPVAGGTITRWQ